MILLASGITTVREIAMTEYRFRKTRKKEEGMLATLRRGIEVKADIPNIAFDIPQCYWPITIKMNELLDARWVFINRGVDTQESCLLVYFKGKGYAIWIGPQATNVRMTVTVAPNTLPDFIHALDPEEVVESGKSYDFNFAVGYVTEHVNGQYRVSVQDEWPASTRVPTENGGISGTLGIPSWALMAGVGLVVVGGVAMVAKSSQEKASL